jgi:hypothetical protein
MIIVGFLNLTCHYILNHLKSPTCGKNVRVTRPHNEGDYYKREWVTYTWFKFKGIFQQPSIERVGAKQRIHSFLGGKETSVWVGLPKFSRERVALLVKVCACANASP